MDKAMGNPGLSDEAGALGALGAWDDLGATAGATGSGLEGVDGPIGMNMGSVGDPQGGYGFGDRGGGGGGGGSSIDGIGRGTHGRGTGRGGYGEGGGGGGGGGMNKGSLSNVGAGAVVMGSLDKSLIDKVIKQNQAKVLYCYQRELVKDPSLQGKVTLNFTISQDGSVAKSKTHTSGTTLNDGKVHACMNSQMKSLKFPEIKGPPTAIVMVKYPFNFGSGG
jgi:hypothetical protein